MSISAVSDSKERSTILRTIAKNSNALEDLGSMLQNIESRLYRPHPIEIGKPDPEMDETVELMIERQGDVIQQLNETTLRIMNRLA